MNKRVGDFILERDQCLYEAKGVSNSMSAIITTLEPLVYPGTFPKKVQRLVQVMVEKV